MGIIKKILAGLAAVAGIAALWFRGQYHEEKAKRARGQAKRAKKVAKAQTKATRAVRKKKAAQKKRRKKPNTKKRNDLNKGW